MKAKIYVVTEIGEGTDGLTMGQAAFIGLDAARNDLERLVGQLTLGGRDILLGPKVKAAISQVKEWDGKDLLRLDLSSYLIQMVVYCTSFEIEVTSV